MQCRSPIVVLLLSMVSEKQSFALRCAVLYCIQSYLYKNEAGKQALLDTLLPSKADSRFFNGKNEFFSILIDIELNFQLIPSLLVTFCAPD